MLESLIDEIDTAGLDWFKISKPLEPSDLIRGELAIVKAILEGGGKLGVSSRGSGNVVEGRVNGNELDCDPDVRLWRWLDMYFTATLL